jgi:predicted HicB family RNase H-like nuclease
MIRKCDMVDINIVKGGYMSEGTKLVRIPEGVWKEARIQAIREGVTMAAWLTQAIKEKLAGQKVGKE